MSQVTRILTSIEQGDTVAAEQLLPVVYDELRGMAAAMLAQEKPGHTLQPTALVHEAYLRLVGSEDTQWQGRRHFFGAAAEAMRRILVDHARRRTSLKRGGDRQRVPMDEMLSASDANDVDLVALDEALTALAECDPVKAEVVKFRYFVGLSNAETAELLEISLATVKRYWVFAKAWLLNEMSQGEEE